MPNFLITLSENCYKEFQNVKQQLDINLDLWSDSDILKMIFEKIEFNKEFLKEIKTIGKSCKGRPLPPKYLHSINMDNIETLSQCPSCDHNICMLEYSMKEIARLEMFSHFDTVHNQSGQFQCTCKRTFDWMPAYLRHKSMCEQHATEKLHVDTTKQNLFENSLESRPMSSNKLKLDLKVETIPTDIIMNPLNNVPSPLFACTTCSLSFANSSLLSNHICFTETRYNNNSQLITDIQPPMPTLDQFPTQIFTPSSHTATSGSILSQSLPLNLSMTSSITLTCHCGVVFNEFQSYHSHNISCKNNSQSEMSTDRFDDSQSGASPSKRILKDIQPNAEGRYQCPCCSKSFPSNLNLKQHYLGMHSTSSKNICSNCNKSFRWRPSYNNHLKICGIPK